MTAPELDNVREIARQVAREIHTESRDVMEMHIGTSVKQGWFLLAGLAVIAFGLGVGWYTLNAKLEDATTDRWRARHMDAWADTFAVWNPNNSTPDPRSIRNGDTPRQINTRKLVLGASDSAATGAMP